MEWIISVCFLFQRSPEYADFFHDDDDDLDIFDQRKQSPLHESDVILRTDPSYRDALYVDAASPISQTAWHTAVPHQSAPALVIHTGEQDSGVYGGFDEFERHVRNPLYQPEMSPTKDVFKLSSHVLAPPLLDEIELQDYRSKMPKKVFTNGQLVHGSLHLPPEGSFSLSDIMYSAR